MSTPEGLSNETYSDPIIVTGDLDPSQLPGALKSGLLGRTACLPFSEGRSPASVEKELEVYAAVSTSWTINETKITADSKCPRWRKCSDCPNANS